MTLHKIDIDTGRHLYDVIVGDNPTVTAADIGPAFVDADIPDGITHPLWDGEQWISDPNDNDGETD